MESGEEFPDCFLYGLQNNFGSFPTIEYSLGSCFKIRVQATYFELLHWILLDKSHIPTCLALSPQGCPTP